VFVLEVAGGAAGRRFQEDFDELTAGQVRMAVLIAVLGDDGPLAARDCVAEGGAQLALGVEARGRAVYEGDHGGIAAAVQDLLQSNLQGTELAAFGRGIGDQERAAGADYGKQVR
jgi:hypothetical protein